MHGTMNIKFSIYTLDDSKANSRNVLGILITYPWLMYGSFPQLELGKLVHDLLSELRNLIPEIIARHKCRIYIRPC